MNDLKSKILEVLATILTPNGKNMVSADIIRALNISHGDVSFVIEVEGSEVSASTIQVVAGLTLFSAAAFGIKQWFDARGGKLF